LGEAFAQAVVVVQGPPGELVSVRRTIRVAPIALALLAVMAWTLRRDLPHSCLGALLGLSFAVPVGLAAGLAAHASIESDPYSSPTGNIALDLAILTTTAGIILGAVTQLCLKLVSKRAVGMCP
jgi:hypothetical protein